MPIGQVGGAFLPGNAYGIDSPVTTIPGDATVVVATGIYWLTKGSAAAIRVPTPTAGDVGTEMRFIAGTAFAHVVTSTGNIDNGVTGGGKNTWTSAAFVGSSITLVAMPNLKYSVVAQVLGTVA